MENTNDKKELKTKILAIKEKAMKKSRFLRKSMENVNKIKNINKGE